MPNFEPYNEDDFDAVNWWKVAFALLAMFVLGFSAYTYITSNEEEPKEIRLPKEKMR